MVKLVEKLERVFFLNFLQLWLSLNDVSLLDTALTSKPQRQAFLELLSKSNCRHSNDGDYQFTSWLLIEWMSRRNILFDALTVSSDTLNSSTIGIFDSETLTSLSCSHFWQQEQKIGDPEVASQVNRIFSTIPNLSDIKLTNSKFVTGLDVTTINCPHLTSCDFTFLTKLTDDFVVNLSQKCPKLTRVVLSQCKLLTDTSIVSLVKSCKALSFLHIGGCKKLTAVTFQSIASECTQLTGFNMDYCSKAMPVNSGGSLVRFGGFGGFSQQGAPAANVLTFGVPLGSKPLTSIGGTGASNDFSTEGYGFGFSSTSAATTGQLTTAIAKTDTFGAAPSTTTATTRFSSSSNVSNAADAVTAGIGATTLFAPSGDFGFGSSSVSGVSTSVPAGGFSFCAPATSNSTINVNGFSFGAAPFVATAATIADNSSGNESDDDGSIDYMDIDVDSGIDTSLAPSADFGFGLSLVIGVSTSVPMGGFSFSDPSSATTINGNGFSFGVAPFASTATTATTDAVADVIVTTAADITATAAADDDSLDGGGVEFDLTSINSINPTADSAPHALSQINFKHFDDSPAAAKKAITRGTSSIRKCDGLISAGSISFIAGAPDAVVADGSGGGNDIVPGEKSHEELIIDIVRTNPLLTELHVRDSNITDKLLLAIAECLPNFRVLDFSGCEHVTDEGLVPLAESCKLLSELIYEPPGYNVTQRTFLAIATHCPEFRRFRLPVRLITKAVLAEVSMDIDNINLSAGILDCSHFEAADGEIDGVFENKEFQLLAPYCIGAHTYVCGYKQMPEDHVEFLQRVRNVKHLDLVHMGTDLTDKQLLPIAKVLTQLESAVFSSQNYRAKFSNNSLLSLTENNPFLTKLDIGHCNKLTDATLAKIAEHCRGLKWLNICRAQKTTDEGFLSLANNCRRLQYLDASGCIALTDVGILSVIARCKELQTFLFNTYRFPDFDVQVKERYEMHFEVGQWEQD